MKTVISQPCSKRLDAKHFKLSNLVVAIFFVQSQFAVAAVNEPTKNIENIADSRYHISGDSNSRFSTTSNQVALTARYQAAYSLTISEPPIQTIDPGQTVTWSNTLTNAGTSDENITLSFDLPTGLSDFVVYQDVNNNGKIDATDVLIDTSNSLPLAKNSSTTIILQAKADNNLQDGDKLSVDVNAVVNEDTSIKVSATDSLVVVTPKIDFFDSGFNNTLNQSPINNDVFAQISFAECNLQSNQIDQIWVTIKSSKTGDVYALKAIETGVNTGKYRLSAPTENNANAIDDKIIQTLKGDNLIVRLESCLSPNASRIFPPRPIDHIDVSTHIASTLDIVDVTPKLQIEKIGDVTTAELGDYVNYSIKITNSGDATAYDINLKDELPTGFDIVPGSVRVNDVRVTDFSQSGKYQKLSLPNMSAGQTVLVKYRVLVGSTAFAGDGINHALATAKDDTGNSFSSLESIWEVDVRRSGINSEGIIVGKVYNDINRDGIQQLDEGELGVAGVKLYMENGNFVVTDAQGKYDFYGISAKTHVIKIDAITLPANVQPVIQNNRNLQDASSRFVDLKHGELHRADFGIATSSDYQQQLQQTLIQRRETVNSKNDTLEQAVKSRLSMQPELAIDKNVIDANGCKTNPLLDGQIRCDTLFTDDQHQANNQTTDDRLTVNLITPPKEHLLENVLKTVSNNDIEFINLTDGQQLTSLKNLVQVKAPLDRKFELYVNNKLISENKIGKTATQQKNQVAGYDYYAVDFENGHNQLKGIVENEQGNIIAEKSIDVIAPNRLQDIEYIKQNDDVVADGQSKYQVVIRLKDFDSLTYAANTPISIDTNIGTINLKDNNVSLPGIQTDVVGGELLIPIIAPNNPGQGYLKVSAGDVEKNIPLRFLPKLRSLIAVGMVEGSFSFQDFDSDKISNADGFFEEQLATLHEEDSYTAHGRAALFLKGKIKGDYLLTLAYDSDKQNERLFRDIKPQEYYPVYGDSAAKGFEAQSSSRLYIRLDKGRSFAMYGDIKTNIDNDEAIKLGQYKRTLTGFKAHYETDNTQITTFAAKTSTSKVTKETRGLGISGPYPLAENFQSVVENSETVVVITRSADNPGVILSQKTLTRFSDYEIDPLSHSLYLKTPIASLDLDGNPIFLRVTVEVQGDGEKYWVGGIAAKQRLNDAIRVGATYINSDHPTDPEQLASINTLIHINDHTKLVAEYAISETINPDFSINNQINAQNMQSDVDEQFSGDAYRAELTYNNKNNTTGKLYYQNAEKGFVPSNSSITSGRTEAGLKLQKPFATNNDTKIKLDAIYSNEHNSDVTRQGVSVDIERSLNKYLVAEVGVRHYKQDAGAFAKNTQETPKVTTVGNNTTNNNDLLNQSALANTNKQEDVEATTVHAKLTAQLPKYNHSKVFVEYEQDLENSHRNATSVGGETKLGESGRMYMRHDIINSLSGQYGLNDSDERQRTVVGFDTQYMQDGSIYSEYRAKDALSARESEAAIGLKNTWYVADGLTVNTLFEHLESLDGDEDKSSTAASVAMEYLANDNYKVSGRFERRWGKDNNGILASAGIVYKYDEQITLLAKDTYSLTDYKADGYRNLNRLQLGAAYRDYDSNQLDVLTKLEYRIDENTTGNDGYKKNNLIWSLHGNYHPTQRLVLSGHYAGKYTEYDSDSIISTNTAHMAYFRGLYDLTSRWDVGLQSGVYWNDNSDKLSYALGAEVGYNPFKNFWISGGYNLYGFSDEDIAYDDITAEGGYIKLRFKFDENLLAN